MRSLQLVALASAAAVGATPVQAQDRPPDWQKLPSAEDLASVWPAKALKAGIGGKALISCIVTVQGTLRACHTVSETPEGSGFGGAAIALSPQFLMRPALKDGAPVEASVTIPVNFPRPDRQTGSHLKPVTDTDFPGERVYTGIPWITAPSHAEVMAAYPAKAREAKLGGTAVLDCRIGKDGGISACKVLNETPDNKGFGAAAKTLAGRFKGPTTDSKGEPTAGARTHLPINFAAAALETGAPVIGRPEWRALPAMEDFTAVIPAAARQAKVYRARVVMSCTVGAEGGLEACKTTLEEPGGLGYADAAMALSSRFRLSVWTAEGLPTIGGMVRVPLRFDLEEAMQGKATTP